MGEMHCRLEFRLIFFFFSDPRKHWLLEDNNTNAIDNDGGFINRHGPFQSSLNEGKNKRVKKPGLLRGIGHMFRFGKHRKDGIVPTDIVINDKQSTSTISTQSIAKELATSGSTSNGGSKSTIGRSGPPNYQPPPPVAVGIPVVNGIQQNDVFNHRYSHYVNYEELQQQIRYAKTIIQFDAIKSPRKV